MGQDHHNGGLEHEAVGDASETDAAAVDHYAAVRQLFSEHNRALVKFLYTRLASEQEARDLAQEAYVRLLQLHQPGTVGFLRGYLFRIAANLSIDKIRQRKVQENAPKELFDDLHDSEQVEHRAMTREQFTIAWQALQELNPNIAKVFMLRFVEGYSTTEIGELLAVDERTVRKYLTRGLLHCRERLIVDNAGGSV